MKKGLAVHPALGSGGAEGRDGSEAENESLVPPKESQREGEEEQDEERASMTRSRCQGNKEDEEEEEDVEQARGPATAAAVIPSSPPSQTGTPRGGDAVSLASSSTTMLSPRRQQSQPPPASSVASPRPHGISPPFTSVTAQAATPPASISPSNAKNEGPSGDEEGGDDGSDDEDDEEEEIVINGRGLSCASPASSAASASSSTPAQQAFAKKAATAAISMGKRAQYQSLPLGTNMNIGSMNIVANIVYRQKTQEVVKLRMWTTDGPIYTRVLGCLGGAFLLAHHGLGLLRTLHHAVTHPQAHRHAVPDLLALLLAQLLGVALGAAATLLECRAVLCTRATHKKTREYLKLLSYLWGRGLLYLLAAAVLALRALTTVDAGHCLYFASLGCLDLFVGLTARARLGELRGTLTEDEELIRAKFERRPDFTRQGRIPASDLATVCAELGSRLSHQELESAILTLDANRNGEVEYEAFLEWWRTR